MLNKFLSNNFNSYIILLFSFIFPFLIWLTMGKIFIKKLKLIQNNKNTIRSYVPSTHLKKQGVPSLGGVIIITLFILTLILFGNLKDFNTYIFLITALFFFILGFYDDYCKLFVNNTQGIKSIYKFFFEIVISSCVLFLLHINYDPIFTSTIFIPLFNTNLVLGNILYSVFAIFILSGTANATNLTDGLDGLLSLVSLPIILLAGLICWNYLNASSPYKILSTLDYHTLVNLAVVITGFLGSILGFIIFNKAPAKIFMGDSGSLPIGAIIALIFILLKIELLLAFAGIVYICETLSVLIQVTYFKKTGKRLFLMAPLHHHFEKKGFSETRIVFVFLITSVLASLTALSLFFYH